jgi:hypothetical protein
MGDETRGFTPWTARGSSSTGQMSGRVAATVGRIN